MADKDTGKTPTKADDTAKKAAAPAPATTEEKAEKPLPPAPELPAAGKTLVDRAVKANGGAFPTKEYGVKVAFGHTYAAGTYTDHGVDWVQKLVWDLRQLDERPSYRSIAEALGIQCSAITEAVTHGYSRKAKVADDSWKVNTGGRVKFLQERDAAAKSKPAAAS
jgi:hypothetical protein